MSTSTSTSTGVRAGTLPRVNLLPSEISEGAKFRNLQAALALTVVLALGVVGVLSYVASGDVSDAQAQVDQAQVQTTQLQGQVASYADVPALYAQVDLANAQLNTAMGQEVRYSFLLRDLSLSLPSTIFLDTLTMTQPVDAPGSVKGAWGGAGVATISFHGQAGALNDVAAWLDSLAKNAHYSDPYVTTATRTATGPTQPFLFDSSVILTSKALTNRYADKAGN